MFGSVVDASRALEQFDHLVDTLVEIGAAPIVIEQSEDHPDMIFTANAGLVVGDDFIVSNFRYVERRGESAKFAAELASLGKRVLTLDTSVSFEGAGDALLLNDRLIMAYGFRTDLAAHSLVRKISNLDVVSVGLSNPYYYHLDTCLSVLPSGRFIYFPEAFDDRSRLLLKAMDGVPVTEKLCVRYGCNLLTINDVIVTAYADDHLRSVAESESLVLREVEVDEFLKAGGGVRCLCLPLDVP
jgi:N-dimethylarginine dimethylaminohydrolase